MSSKSVWSIKEVPGTIGLHSETLSPKKSQQNKTNQVQSAAGLLLWEVFDILGGWGGREDLLEEKVYSGE